MMLPKAARASTWRKPRLETLESRRLLSGDSLGIQLLPARFNPAVYAQIGPQRIPDRPDRHSEIAAAIPIGGSERFTSDAELADYLVESAVRRYVEYFGKTVDSLPPFGFAGWPGNAWDYLGAEVVALSSVSDDETIAGTGLRPIAHDGQHIYLLENQELLIFSASDQPTLVSRTKIHGYPGGVFLDGDRLTVVSLNDRRRFYDSGFPSIGSGLEREANHVAVFEVTDPARPRLISQTDLDGYFGAVRYQDGRLHLTLVNDILLPSPLAERIEESTGVIPGLWTVETEAAFRARVLPMLLDEVLPRYRVRTVGETGPRQFLQDPSGIHKPLGTVDNVLLTVVAIDTRAENPVPQGATSILAGGEQAAQLSGDHWYWFVRNPATADAPETTKIRKYRLTAEGLELTAVTELAGGVRWLSEHAGQLRVFVGETSGAGVSHHLLVLSEQGTTLVEVGALRDFAPGVQVTATRVFGSRAFVQLGSDSQSVLALDFTDPANPLVAARVSLPAPLWSFDALDEQTLLAIDRDPRASNEGASDTFVTVIDVADVSQPVVRGQHRFLGGEWTFFERDRTLWDPQSGTLAFPTTSPAAYTLVDADGDGVPETQQWRQDRSLQVFQVASGGELGFRGQAIHPREVLWSLLIGDVLYSVSEATLRASLLAEPSVTLGEADYNRAYVGRQLNPLQPGQDALLVIGGYEVDRFELEPLPSGQLEVRRAGELFGRYDLTGIRQIVASDPQHYTDRVLVKNLEAMPAEIDIESLQYRLELGDANRDGVVGLSDLALLKTQLGRQGAKWAADIDRDGDVDIADLEFMRSNFGGKIQYALYFDEIVLEDGTIGRDHQLFSTLAIDAALSAEEA